ncbi:DUF6599 family protein [Pajaroellobacter abortibovis]|uniref:DUF6599 family protein n=1 Tax=Pajaroellobacter abortibovis TaxID=1882918 RepID=UPI0012EBF25C|nr:DUF6599 family protein [Pajaroellobacter abortibovis]
MEQVCTTAFDGECEIYRWLGVQKVTALRYKGGTSAIEVYLSEFASPVGTYAVFTKRRVAGGESCRQNCAGILRVGWRVCNGYGARLCLGRPLSR